MKNTNRAITGSILGIVNMLISMSVMFVMMPFVIHTVGDTDYSLWIFLSSFIGYYALLDLGLSVAVTRFIAKAIGKNDIEEIKTLFSTATIFFCILGFTTFLICIAGVFIAPYYVTSPDRLLLTQKLLVVLSIVSFGQFSMRGVYAVLFATIRHDLMNILGIIKLLTRSGIIFAFLYNGYGILALAVITVISEILSYLIDYIVVRRVAPDYTFSWNRFDKATLVKIFHYGKYSVIAQVSSLLKLRMIPVIVTAIISLQLVVVYSIAIRLVEIFRDIVDKLLSTVLPLLSQLEGSNDKEQAKKVFLTTINMSTIISLMIGGFIFLYSGRFITLWMGPDYIMASYLVNIMVLAFILEMAQEPGRALLLSKAQHQKHSLVTLVESFLAVTFGIILSYKVGEMGMAMGLLIPVIIAEVFIKPFFICNAIGLKKSTYYRNYVIIGLKIVPAMLIYALYMLSYGDTWSELMFTIIGQCVIMVPFCIWAVPSTARRYGIGILNNVILRRVIA